jgi:hypothetical protein
MVIIELSNNGPYILIPNTSERRRLSLDCHSDSLRNQIAKYFYRFQAESNIVHFLSLGMKLFGT